MRRLGTARKLIQQALPNSSIAPKRQNPQWLMFLLGGSLGLLIVFGLTGETGLIIVPLVLFLIYLVINAVRTSGANTKQRLLKVAALWKSVLLLLTLWGGMMLIGRINASLTGIFFIAWCVVTIGPSTYKNYVRNIRLFLSADGYAEFTGEHPRYSDMQLSQINVKYLHASTALNAGHIEEAESLARECVALGQHSNLTLLSGSLNALALTLIYQKRYQEAMNLIEIAIQLNPTTTAILTSLAEIYFEQDIEPQRVLEITEFAKRYTTTGWLSRRLGIDSQLINDGVRAWALTRLGRYEEGDALIQNAIQHISKKYITGTAYLYFMQGKIDVLKGNPEQSKEWLTRASQIDSGLYGQLAANALKELPPN